MIPRNGDPMNNPGRDNPRPQANTISVRSFLAILWRRRLLATLVLILVGGTIAAGLVMAPRTYTAVSSVSVTPPPDVSQSPANYDNLLGTMADVAQSQPVLQDVAQVVPARTVRELASEVKAEVIFGTVTIQVSVNDADPVVAARIANAVVAALPDHDPSNGSFVFNTTEPATVPLSFTSPNLKVAGLAGVLLALALAVAAAVAFDKVRRTVDTPEEVAETTGVGVLGVIPAPSDPDSVVAGDAETPEFKGLRALRVALEFASSNHPTQTLVVAPAAADPWSGWLEVNLATSLAEVGRRVLIIDANRTDRHRHPALAAPGEPGLYDLLAGSVSMDAATIAGPVDGVTVVPLGNADLAAPSLLEMRYRSMLDDIDDKYDVVLVHAAPINESDDARIMAIAGSLLLNVPVGKVKQRGLEGVVADLHEVGTRIIGTVLVGARSGRRTH